MAPHSSTLSWKIPWTEDPEKLQSMGSRRVRHNWVTSLLLFTVMHWKRKWQPTPVFLPGEWAAIYGVAQSWTRLKWLSGSSSMALSGGGNDNPLQYSYLKNPMDRGVWQAAVHRFAESDTTQHRYDLIGRLPWGKTCFWQANNYYEYWLASSFHWLLSGAISSLPYRPPL